MDEVRSIDHRGGSAPKPDKLLTGRTLASKISSRWAISSEVERFLDTEEVRSSILLSPTKLVIKKTGKSPSFFAEQLLGDG